MDSEVDELTSLMNSCPKWVCGEKELVAYKNVLHPLYLKVNRAKLYAKSMVTPRAKEMRE
jgi:hypothetical protein